LPLTRNPSGTGLYSGGERTSSIGHPWPTDTHILGVSESSRAVIVVTASVKDERGGQGHTSTSLLH
jgi:hypothetical protein